MPESAARSLRPPKDYWFTHGLQKLSAEKFLKVVTKILAGEYVLLRFPYGRAFDSALEKGMAGGKLSNRRMGG